MRDVIGLKRNSLNERSLLTALTLAVLVTSLESVPRHAGAGETHLRPLYPLGLVVFPGERISMIVSEPRHRRLIADSAQHGANFGIVTVIPGGVSNVGTEMVVERMTVSDDGASLDVEARGVRVFNLHAFESEIDGKPYPGGRVTFFRNDPTADVEIQGALVQLYNRMQYLLGTGRKLAPPFPENLSFIIGHDVGLSRAQELSLISMPVEGDRQAFLFQHLLNRR